MPPMSALDASANIAPPQNQAAEKRAFGVFTIRLARKNSSLARMKLVIDVIARVSIAHSVTTGGGRIAAPPLPRAPYGGPHHAPTAERPPVALSWTSPARPG